jgi:hypothetical protein
VLGLGGLANAIFLTQGKLGGAGGSGEARALPAGGEACLPVAELVQRSTEALTGLVRSFYLLYLGRSAEGGEEQGWVRLLLAGQPQEAVLSAFLGTEEFHRRAEAMSAAGTPDEKFVQSLHVLLLQRAATPPEVGAWLSALPTLERQGLASCLLRSQEFRALQVASFFQELLPDSAPPAEVGEWAASPFDLLTIRALLQARF